MKFAFDDTDRGGYGYPLITIEAYFSSKDY